MKNRRLIFFALMIAVGITAGLLVGWQFMPPKEQQNAPIDNLRIDYQTDLVLMVAEHFSVNSDTLLALDQLAKLSEGDPLTLVGSSLAYAREIGYPQPDVILIGNLLTNIDPQLYQQWLGED